MTSVNLEVQQESVKRTKKLHAQQIKDRFISIFIGIFALAWIFPIAWTLWSSLRPYKEIRAGGVFSPPQELGFANYTEAIDRMQLPQYFWNTVVITLPAVFLILLFGSLIAFCSPLETCCPRSWCSFRCSRCTWRLEMP